MSRKSKSGSTSGSEKGGSGKKSSNSSTSSGGSKSWDKYAKVRKAVKRDSSAHSAVEKDGGKKSVNSDNSMSQPSSKSVGFKSHSGAGASSTLLNNSSSSPSQSVRKKKKKKKVVS